MPKIWTHTADGCLGLMGRLYERDQAGGRTTWVKTEYLKCKKCGTPQFPAQIVCVKPDCGAIGEMEDYSFSDKKATLFTYTGDMLAFSMNPPAIYGIVDFEGGGRYWFDMTDADQEDVKVDMPVEMSFRKKYVDENTGIHGYFWKTVPVIG